MQLKLIYKHVKFKWYGKKITQKESSWTISYNSNKGYAIDEPVYLVKLLSLELTI